MIDWMRVILPANDKSLDLHPVNWISTFWIKLLKPSWGIRPQFIGTPKWIHHCLAFLKQRRLMIECLREERELGENIILDLLKLGYRPVHPLNLFKDSKISTQLFSEALEKISTSSTLVRIEIFESYGEPSEEFFSKLILLAIPLFNNVMPKRKRYSDKGSP